MNYRTIDLDGDSLVFRTSGMGKSLKPPEYKTGELAVAFVRGDRTPLEFARFYNQPLCPRPFRDDREQAEFDYHRRRLEDRRKRLIESGQPFDADKERKDIAELFAKYPYQGRGKDGTYREELAEWEECRRLMEACFIIADSLTPRKGKNGKPLPLDPPSFLRLSPEGERFIDYEKQQVKYNRAHGVFNVYNVQDVDRTLAFQIGKNECEIDFHVPGTGGRYIRRIARRSFKDRDNENDKGAIRGGAGWLDQSIGSFDEWPSFASEYLDGIVNAALCRTPYLFRGGSGFAPRFEGFDERLWWDFMQGCNKSEAIVCRECGRVAFVRKGAVTCSHKCSAKWYDNPANPLGRKITKN